MATSDFDWDREDEDDVVIRLPPEYLHLNADEVKLSVRDLWERYMEGKLNLQAEFQREYVWDDKRASRFIESLLLNLPVPAIFVAENRDGSWEVVDGHQRLESLFGFLQPLAAGPAQGAMLPPKFRALRLRSLEVLDDDLNGRTADDLSSKDRATLLDRPLTVVSIPKSADRDLRFVLFARLNLGSVPLNAQELRNCVYRGPYNHLIRELAADPRVLGFFGRSTPHKRMRDRELVVRFFALVHRRGQFRTPFASVLNDEMEQYQLADPEECARFRREFRTAMDWTTRVFGQEACRLFHRGDEQNPRGRWGRWSDIVYESQMVGFCEFGERLEEIVSKREVDPDLFVTGVRHKLVEVMCGDGFLETVREGTKKPQTVERRLALWGNMLATAVDNPDFVVEDAERIREALRRGAFCSICESPIDSLDDGARLTSPNDGGVVHRSCYRRWASQLPGRPVVRMTHLPTSQ